MTKLIGTDTVGVIDASDPLDIIVSAQINETKGTGASATVATTNLELNDEMPDTAYLLLTPHAREARHHRVGRGDHMAHGHTHRPCGCHHA